MERYIQGKKFILIADNTRKQSKTLKKDEITLCDLRYIKKIVKEPL